MVSIPPFPYTQTMAKTKSISPESGTGQVYPTSSMEASVQAEVQDTPEAKTKKKEAAPETAAEIPASALAILKKFPDYKELYIDTDGSMYTVKTAPAIRKGAVLYKNPYYES